MTAVPCLQRSKRGTAESGALVCPDVAEAEQRAGQNLAQEAWLGGERGESQASRRAGKARERARGKKWRSADGRRWRPSLAEHPVAKHLPPESFIAQSDTPGPCLPEGLHHRLCAQRRSSGRHKNLVFLSGRSHISSLINPHHATPTRPEPLRPPGLLSTSTTSLRCAAFNRYLAPTVAPNPHQRESHTTLLKHRPPSDSDDTRADADASRFSRHSNTPQRHRISSIPGA